MYTNIYPKIKIRKPRCCFAWFTLSWVELNSVAWIRIWYKSWVPLNYMNCFESHWSHHNCNPEWLHWYYAVGLRAGGFVSCKYGCFQELEIWAGAWFFALEDWTERFAGEVYFFLYLILLLAGELFTYTWFLLNMITHSVESYLCIIEHWAMNFTHHRVAVKLQMGWLIELEDLPQKIVRYRVVFFTGSAPKSSKCWGWQIPTKKVKVNLSNIKMQSFSSDFHFFW